MKNIYKFYKSSKTSGMVLILFVALILQNPIKVNAQTLKDSEYKQVKTPQGFIENKGQIIDQNNKPNPDVKYLLSMPGLNVQLKANSFSYDAYVVEHNEKKAKESTELPIPILPEPEDITFRYHRIDIEFIGANASPQLIAEEAGSDYMNYYTTGTTEEGATYVNHYGKITYKNLYPGIDLVFFSRPGTAKPVEYNFIVHPKADLSLIQWKYNGSDDIKLHEGIIQIRTAHGLLNESIPHSFEKETGEPINIGYKVLQEGIFAFDGKNDQQNTLVIDPIPNTKWATFFGGSLADLGYCISTDVNGNVLVTGATLSTTMIATTGAHQTTIGGGTNDGFVAKFDANGNRLWATYYGGTLIDFGGSICADKTGNVYVGGCTTSTTGISTTGAFQVTLANSYYDAFVIKFSPTGTRLWGTYYGGTGNDLSYYNSMVIDTSANVYLTGVTNSTGTQMSTTGAYKTTMLTSGDQYDGFLIKFNSSGARQWSSYFGGTLLDYGFGLGMDATGNILMTGYTSSSTGLATIGAYQTVYGGSTYDAYLAKWTQAGACLWATYFGGSANDIGYGVGADPSGNIFLTGYTLSTNAIATTGAYQTTFGGGTMDAYLAKFSPTGSRLWSTYFGGSLGDMAQGLATDLKGNAFLIGRSLSTSGISTTGAFQTVFGGGTTNGDAIIAKFTSTGALAWGTYYGGTGEDHGGSIALDPTGNLYITGNTGSTIGMTTTGAYQVTNAGGTTDAFVAKFQELVGTSNAGINKLTNPSGYICAGNQDVKVEITNAGFNTIDSVKVEWQINGVSQTPVNVKTPILSGVNSIVTLGNVNFPLNVLKTIKIWTSMPNGVTDVVNSNDTIVVQRKAGLNGTYTIGGTTPDFVSFSAAVSDLNTFGICGPVVFKVRSGTYNERISLNQITGSSKFNTITFKGSGKDSTILTSFGTSTADMATVLLNGTDHIAFRNMTIKNTGPTYATGIWFTGTADTNLFINLKLVVDTTSTSANVNAIVGSGSTTAATTDGNTGNFNLFDSLEIKGGYHGIRINGPNTTTIYASGNTISHSTFTYQYQYGIYLHNQSSAVVVRNTIKPFRFTTSYSLYLDYSANIEVANNVINANDCGMYFNYVNRYLVNTGFNSRVYNNMVSSTSGYALNSNQSYLLKIWHNSFSADPAMSVVRFVSSLTIDLVNNHIQNRGNITGRYALHVDNISTFTTFDYNNYFTTGSFLFIGTTDYANLPVIQAVYPLFNQNSFNQDPLFYSTTDLHTSINLSGTYVGIDQDIDDDFRNTTSPVVGADEVNIQNNAGISRLVSPAPAFCAGSQDVIVKIGNYGNNAIDSVRVSWKVNGLIQPDTFIKTTLALRGFLDVTLGSISFTSGESKSIKIWTSMPNGVSDPLPKNDTLLINVRTGLSGIYKIGGIKPDYPDFNSAVSALSLLGVCSPVVFNVSAGTYSEKVIIGEIKNASLTNTITFRGSGKTSTNLTYTGSSTADWATLFLKGTDYVVFRDMTISAMGTSYGIGILLTSLADSNRFVNLALQTSTTATSSNLVGIAVIANSTNLYTAPAQPGDGNVFDSLEVNGGFYGIYSNGKSSYQTVSNSAFTEQASDGINCSNQNYLKVFHNSITTTRTTSFSAINIADGSNIKVHGNSINTVSQYGIYLLNDNFSDRDTNFRSAIYNNMISNTVGYSLYSENSEFLAVLHNSFRSVGNSSAIYAAVYFKGSGNIDLRNNHIRNDNPSSYALYADMATFDSLDYNNYYSFGSFVLIGTPFPNLTALKNGLPQFNQNSYSQNPQYVSLTNLHTTAFISGIYVGVDEDIDGEPRCPKNISVGADDENQGFAKPAISTNHKNFFTKYPVRFSNNISGLPGTTVKWYVNGSYITDSASFQYIFNNAGLYKVTLQAERCIYKDSAVVNIQIVPGNKMIVLNGPNPDSIRVFSSYADPGSVAKDFFGTDITARVVVGNNLDTAILGSYYYWYTVKDYWGNKDSVPRTVVVIDDVAPMLYLIGNDTMTIEVFGTFSDPGAMVTDNYYINPKIVIDSSKVNRNVVGIYRIDYTSTDGSSNTGTISRWIKVVDTGLPIITLIGKPTVEVDVFSQYFEAGAKVTDNYCKSGLQWFVDIYPATDTLITDTLTYTATDCYGNAALPVTRIVKVVDRQKPTISLKGFSYVTIRRWQTYVDSGVTIDDNYYPEDTLQSLLNVTNNVDVLIANTYNVCYQVTDPSGNKSVNLCRTVEVKESISGINSPGLKGQISLYPNPNNGRFTLDFANSLSELAQIEVLDITGKEVYKTTTSEQQTKLNLDNLSNGIYQVRIQYGKEFAVLRMNLIR
jgi:hypothetical protein